MALEDYFVWGSAGSKLTPEQIATLKAIEAKRAGGIDTSPVGSWTQGAARVADAMAGAFRRGSLGREEKENTSYNESILSGLLGGGGSTGSPDVAAATSVPMSGAGQEVAASSPGIQAPSFANDGTELGAYLSDPSRRAALPAGMRNNNPGNIKFVGQKIPGIVGPSSNTDQGDPQAVFDTPESGMRAMYGLLGKKYAGGKLTPNQMIAGNMGWTPGNYEAAKNVARYAGIGPDDDIGFSDPAKAAKFMRGLILQEHGNKGALYPESMLMSAVGGQPVQVASASPQTATDAIAAVSPPSGALAYAPQQQAPELPAPTVVPNAPQVASPAAAVAPAPLAPPSSPIQVAQNAIPSGPALAGAMRVLSDPRANANTKAIAEVLVRQQQARQQAILEQQLKQSDPGYQADLRLKNLQADQIANPRISPTDQANIDLNKDKFKFEQDSSALTPGIKEYNAYATDEKAAGRVPVGRLDYERAVRAASANNTTINNGEGNKFYNTLDENNAKIFSNLSDAGIQGRSKIGQIDQLDSLLQSTGSGWATVLKSKAGDIGINTEGLSDIQAASAMLSKMIPEQRAPGSGPVSDADLAGFRNSLPRLINQPGGNATIINTMRGLTQYQIKMGEIADKVANRELKDDGTIYTPADGRRDIANLPNPLANFKPPEPGQENKGWSPVQTDVPGVTIRRKN